MADKKMTRKEALEFAIYAIERSEFGTEEAEQSLEVLKKMIASIDKQAKRPRSKSSARIQNENSAKALIQKLMETHRIEPFNATWIAENTPYVMTSQRGYHVAKIAIEWGALEEITIKKRTFYVFNENYSPTEQF